MNNVLEKIKQSMREYDPDIKFSSSSALTDLMINPLASILSPFQTDLDQTKNEQSLIDPENITETELDRYAANFFVSRTQGAKATGYVRVYFDSPRTLFVDPSVYFETAGGKRFNVTGAYSVTEAQMRANISEYPYYDSGLIPVEAETAGVDSETGPNTITKVFGLSIEASYVKNPVAITGGTARDTNTQLRTRILNSAINGTISSDLGIQITLMNNFESMTDVVVIGAGDDEMKRDIVYTTSGGDVLSLLPSEFYRSDYLGAIAGIQTPPANRSRGYWGVFYVEVPAGSGIQPEDIPNPSQFTDEWSTDQYTYVYRINDAYYQTVTAEKILEETFSGGTADNDGWLKADGTTVDGALLDIDEITTSGTRIRLGKFLPRIPERVWVEPRQVEEIIEIINDIADRPQRGRENLT